MKSKIKIGVLILGLVLLVWSRFYNLETSARFLWDESSDLVRMQELYQNPRLTMIGPISEDNIKVFGSLTYYLTLPFVAIFNFSPVSAAYATAFFGILTVILLILVFEKLKAPISLVTMFILLLSSYPLLQSARWAWNPHFVPFWQALGLFSFLAWGNIGIILSGLFFGLTIHHHYYALFVAVGFGLIVAWKKELRFKKIFLYLLGLGIAILPFVLFDLTHPPGLFISRMIAFGQISNGVGSFNLTTVFNNLINIPLKFTNYLSGSNLIFGIIILVLSLLNIFKLKKDESQKWILVVIAQFLGLALISGRVDDHYLLPAVIFYYLWIVSSYKKSVISKMLIYVLIISNIITLPKLINRNNWETNIKASEDITNYVISKCQNDCKNYNLAVLGSPDINTKGRRYRDLLKIKNIELARIDKYWGLKGAFFVSYADWNDLKNDPSYEIDNYRKLNPTEVQNIKNSKWKVYFFEQK